MDAGGLCPPAFLIPQSSSSGSGRTAIWPVKAYLRRSSWPSSSAGRLFLEGEAGVGKTEVAKVLSRMLDTPLIRLQCYEGIDVYQAVYEWDYPRQLLHIRAAEAFGTEEDRERFEDELYTRQFLVSRPLLQALEYAGPMPPVLLIDEVGPGGRRVRGVLVGDTLGVRDHGPGAWYDPGRPPPDSRLNLQPDPRGPRRPQTPLPVLLHRPPNPGAGGRDSSSPSSRRGRGNWPGRWLPLSSVCASWISTSRPALQRPWIGPRLWLRLARKSWTKT